MNFGEFCNSTTYPLWTEIETTAGERMESEEMARRLDKVAAAAIGYLDPDYRGISQAFVLRRAMLALREIPDPVRLARADLILNIASLVAVLDFSRTSDLLEDYDFLAVAFEMTCDVIGQIELSAAQKIWETVLCAPLSKKETEEDGNE